MGLVNDWKDFWKWSGTHVVAVASALPYAWAQLPPELKEQVPEQYLPYIGVLFFAIFTLARLRKQ